MCKKVDKFGPNETTSLAENCKEKIETSFRIRHVVLDIEQVFGSEKQTKNVDLRILEPLEIAEPAYNLP